jgi:hypothetical protein
VLLGAVCFTRLPVDLLPNVSLPDGRRGDGLAQCRARRDGGAGDQAHRAGRLLGARFA